LVQTSVPTDLVSNGAEVVSLTVVCSSHSGGWDGQTVVLVELFRQISPLRSEDPKVILRLFVRLDEIYYLEFVGNGVFITRIMPLVFGSLLKFLGGCLRERVS